MAQVTGIGGIFFRARDPDVLAGWSHDHLGIRPPGPDIWTQDAGATVLAPFAETSDSFAAGKAWKRNLRVAGLGTLCDALRAKGIAAETRADRDGDGLLARIHDPQGTPIALWEPPPA